MIRNLTAATAAAVATLGLSGCGVGMDLGSGDSNWRTAARCQPPGGGLEPWQVLPNRETCPEAYVGSGSGSGWAPGLPTYEPGKPYRPAPTPPCSRTESLNGFPCYNVLMPSGNLRNVYP